MYMMPSVGKFYTLFFKDAGNALIVRLTIVFYAINFLALYLLTILNNI
jgi:hypothetical protein